jgi:ketosteroid isomerase-like protein
MGPARDNPGAMSEENLRLHRRAIDAVNRRDLDGMLALMDDGVEVMSRIVAIEGGLHGHSGVRQWWESWFNAFPDYDIEVEEIRDSGDATLASLRAVTHGAGSDVPLADVIWQAGRWRDGRCVWWRVFTTEDEALEALGMSK